MAGAGSCCQSNGSPGCENPECCTEVCGLDPFCCLTTWDEVCAVEAGLNCGPGVVCPACPIAGANNEGEPCGTNNNGGCNSTPPAFAPITPGVAKIGTVNAVGGTRDTDWYSFSVASTSSITVDLTSQAIVGAFLATGIDTCALTIVSFASSADCTPLFPATAPLAAAGTYGVIVLPANPDQSGIFDGLPCTSGINTYSVTVTVGPIVICQVDVPPGATDEGEPCGDDTNGGCNSTPSSFTRIASGGDVFHGTAWADMGTRDTDWYSFTLTGSGEVSATLTSEFPGIVGIVDVSDCANPVFVGDVAFSDACALSDIAGGTLPAGEYAVFVSTADEVGGPIFEGIPCGGGGLGDQLGNDYVLEVTLFGDGACEGDTNSDGVVDVQDLVNVITAWNTNNPGADVTDDGTVDVQDLVLVITNWGPC
jgi:hypothetical protein